MIQLLVGSFLLSIVHAAIPNHWLPIVAIGKSEKWSRSQILMVTVISGAAHTVSTIILGIVIGIVGYKMSSAQEITNKIIAPLILFLMGLVYIVLDMKSGAHKHFINNPGGVNRRSMWAAASSLAAAMLLSPCLEIDVYFFSAGTQGSLGIALVSLMYLLVTVSGMLVFVDIGRKGAEKIKWHFLEHHERALTGIILMLLGIFSYFIK